MDAGARRNAALMVLAAVPLGLFWLLWPELAAAVGFGITGAATLRQGRA